MIWPERWPPAQCALLLPRCHALYDHEWQSAVGHSLVAATRRRRLARGTSRPGALQYYATCCACYGRVPTPTTAAWTGCAGWKGYTLVVRLTPAEDFQRRAAPPRRRLASEPARRQTRGVRGVRGAPRSPCTALPRSASRAPRLGPRCATAQ
eukprot:scaffold123748_cov32-Tisochrysis_lutea.AAC.6